VILHSDDTKVAAVLTRAKENQLNFN